MTEPLVRHDHPAADQTMRGRAEPPEDNSAAPPRGWLAAVFSWVERNAQRRALRELARFDDRLLKDIGLSLQQARREADKPFWHR
jgi:uncharacterized protein YjiS (DUF1127 family)